MKLEILDSGNKIVATYTISGLSMLNVEAWMQIPEVTIRLDQLLQEVMGFNTIDLVTQEPVFWETQVRFYLPTPIHNAMLNRLAVDESNEEESSPIQHLTPNSTEVELIENPPVKFDLALIAVAYEIAQNHQPNTRFQVRITDGQ